MSLPRHPFHQDSGIPWVGEVPADWGITPLLGVAQERSNPNIGMQENNLLSLSYGRIVRKNIDATDGLLPESFETYQIVEPGDIVLRLTDLQNDKRSLRSALVAERGIITSAYLAIACTGINPQFMSYLLRAYDLMKVFYSMGGGLRQSMKFSDVKRIPIPVPSIEEQHAIVAFLNRETSRIDALIAEQEKLLALLAEKRQATISQAVTRGLNPDMPVKDSGVEWLGHVPQHWNICLLKRAFSSVDYGISETLDKDDGIAVLRMGNIQDGQVVLNELKYVDSIEKSLLLREGDLLFNRTNSIDLVGKVGLFCGNPNGPTSFASYLVRLRLRPAFDARYFSYLLNAEGLLKLVRASAFIAIGQCNLNPTKYGSLRIAVPPLKEQQNIVEVLDAAMAQNNALRAEAERAIKLLKERRSALISAAVTGKIDVREHLSALAAAA